MKAVAVRSVAPYLPHDFLAQALHAASKIPGSLRGHVLASLAPHLPEHLLGEALAVVRGVSESNARAAGLKALASHLPVTLLFEALDAAAEITDMEERGAVLGVLLPRLREQGLPTAIADAYKVAFVISDESARALALAAFVPYLTPEQVEEALASASVLFKKAARVSEEEAMLHGAAWALMAAHLPPSEARSALERAVAVIREIEDETVRSLALGFLSSRLPPDDGKVILAEAVARARRMTPGDGASLAMAALAPLLPESDAMSLLKEARSAADSTKDKQLKNITAVAIALATAAAPNRSEEERCAAVAAARADISKQTDANGRAALHTLTVVFSPALPDVERAAMLKDQTAAVSAAEEPELPAFASAVMAPYLPTFDLQPAVAKLLETGARLPRPAVLAGLALSQGLAGELYRGNPAVAGNRIAGSPLERLGGPAAVEETAAAIHDVCQWWP